MIFISCSDDDDNLSAPVIGIVSPDEDEVFYVGESITININANAPDGIIENVFIEVNDEQISEFNFAPYSYVWSTNGYPMGTYNIKATAIDNNGLSTTTSREILLTADNPEIETLPFSHIGTTHIKSGILIQSGGNPSIIQKGLCWNTEGNPTVDDHIVLIDAGDNQVYITGLETDTEYHVRAFANNGISTVYGETLTATTISSYFSDTGAMTDQRDGNTYNWVKIGNQTWFAENLRFSDGLNSITYFETPYGLVYLSAPACPDGWHIPTEQEWLELIDYVGGEIVAGGVLKQTGTENWIAPNTGASNTAGFNALPTGYALSSTGIEGTEIEKQFESTAFKMSDHFKVFRLNYDSANMGTTFYGNGNIWASCRCVQDF